MATARGASGTRCGRRIFIFSSGIAPKRGVEIEFRPFRRAKLSGAHEGKGEQFERGKRLGGTPYADMERRSAPKAFGPMMAARCLTTGDAIAPANAPVGSASARPVATAYRNTWPIVARSRFAVSSFPRDSTFLSTARMSGAAISLIGRVPIAGSARLNNHSDLPTVFAALPSRRFLFTSSAAMASKVFAAELACAALASFFAPEGRFHPTTSSWRLGAQSVPP